LRQFQRSEVDINANVCAMLAAARRPVPSDLNVPNQYLLDG